MSQHHVDHPPPGSVTGQCVRTEQHGNQILHVRGDSDSDLEALFSVLHSIDGRPPTSSFKNRKLPASFFRPPDHKAAAAALAACGMMPAMVHGRSVSSPAQLHHPMSAASQGANAATLHDKLSGSGEAFMVDEYTASGAAGSMPNCWDAVKNCPRYFLNNHAAAMWQQQQQQDVSGMNHQHGGGSSAASAGYPQQLQQQRSHPGHHHQMSPVDFSHPQDLGPLPAGWEQGLTADGEVYYINHIDKTTSWYDPRLVRHTRQGSTPVRGSPQQHHCSGGGHMQSPKQQQCQCQMMSHGGAAQSMMGGAPPGAARPNEHFICLELQKLHKEKERLLQEQEAIACREIMLTELVRQTAVTSPDSGPMKCQSGAAPPEGALAMMHAMQSLYGGVGPAGSALADSFLAQCPSAAPGVVESHARQNSTDSGLGGMGTAYSLPRSPDDYLSNVDEMDMQEDGNVALPKPIAVNSCCAMANKTDAGRQQMQQQQQQQQHGDNINMDTEHLVSSLAGDITSELLSDMDVQKIDNLLWL